MKITKPIKPQKGDIIIRTSYGANDEKIYTPFYVAFKFYVDISETVSVIYIAYHSDDYGGIQYVDLAEAILLNYRQYKKIMKLLSKEPATFTDYMFKIINDQDTETTIWETDV